jgi:hypothetical protein
MELAGMFGIYTGGTPNLRLSLILMLVPTASLSFTYDAMVGAF